MQLNISYNVNFTDQDIDDIMCGALEGGITYWCGRAEVVGDYLGEYASDQISRDGKIKLYDSENDDCYELTKKKFINGLKLFVQERGNEVLDGTDLDTTLIDAGDADLIIQYALFGEVVYG